uniref:RING-type domain-containing protein n=1 Tax=Timema poppense TaxID=170557 RepID=A0A7R9H1H7_TIMPO|nr:unnamed protein product [Timema poppensis]
MRERSKEGCFVTDLLRIIKNLPADIENSRITITAISSLYTKYVSKVYIVNTCRLAAVTDLTGAGSQRPRTHCLNRRSAPTTPLRTHICVITHKCFSWSKHVDHCEKLTKENWDREMKMDVNDRHPSLIINLGNDYVEDEFNSGGDAEEVIATPLDKFRGGRLPISSRPYFDVAIETILSKTRQQDGYGIGDDEYSLAYDGCRRLIWHNAHNEAQSRQCWHPGDVLGSLLDLNKPEIVFYINGVPLAPCTHVFRTARSGFFAAASFMSFQQCRFNFGNKPFLYPPSDREFQSFNDHATLSPEEKVILPRHIRLEYLRKLSVREDSCTLCFDKRASVRLVPCGHEGFCPVCADQLAECPMCRASIHEVAHDST